MKILPRFNRNFRYITAASLAVCLTGCWPYTQRDFGGYRTADVEGLKLKVAIKSDNPVPAPDETFRFRLRISDKDNEYASVSITTIDLLYDDGKLSQMRGPWTQDLNELRKLSDGRTSLDIKVASFPIDHSNLTVTYSGYLTNQSGDKIPFFGSKNFKAKKRDKYFFSLHD